MSEHELNRVLLSGRLTSDPDLRELADGTPLCVLRLTSAAGRRVPGASRRGAGELSVLVLAEGIGVRASAFFLRAERDGERNP